MISRKIKLKEPGTRRNRNISIHIYIHTHIHGYIPLYTHTHTHTHTQNCMKEGKHKIYLKVSYIYQLLLFLPFLKQISET